MQWSFITDQVETAYLYTTSISSMLVCGSEINTSHASFLNESAVLNELVEIRY